MGVLILIVVTVLVIWSIVGIVSIATCSALVSEKPLKDVVFDYGTPKLIFWSGPIVWCLYFYVLYTKK